MMEEDDSRCLKCKRNAHLGAGGYCSDCEEAEGPPPAPLWEPSETWGDGQIHEEMDVKELLGVDASFKIRYIDSAGEEQLRAISVADARGILVTAVMKPQEGVEGKTPILSTAFSAEQDVPTLMTAAIGLGVATGVLSDAFVDFCMNGGPPAYQALTDLFIAALDTLNDMGPPPEPGQEENDGE